MIAIKCKNKIAEQLMLNELMKHKDLEIKILTEGFDSFTVMGSDEAADSFNALCIVMAKSLKSSLKLKTNEYNTSGPVNVAMIFNEYLSSFSGENDDLSAIAKDCSKLLEKEIKDYSLENQKELLEVLKDIKKFK